MGTSAIAIAIRKEGGIKKKLTVLNNVPEDFLWIFKLTW